MAYTTGDTILDDHYNGFATSVNTVWGSGTGDYGYGQTSTVSAVSAGTTVTAAQWTTLLARISSAASHQSSSITAISNPTAGSTISAYTALSTNLTTITSNRFSVYGRAAVAESSCSTTTTLTGTIQQTGNWTWGSTDQARYFFNAGGRISVRWDIFGFTAYSKAAQWDVLAGQCGTYYVYAQSSGKSGGSGTPSTNNTNLGWHDLTGTFQNALIQYEDTGPYTANYIQLQLRKSSNIVYFASYWADAAADQTSYNKSVYNVQDLVDGTKQTIFGHEEPGTAYISDTWGDGPTMNVTANG
jgi:hypothetical protein